MTGFHVRQRVFAMLVVVFLGALEAQQSPQGRPLDHVRKALDHLQGLDPGNPKAALSSLSEADRDLITRALLKDIGSRGSSQQNVPDREVLSQIASMGFAQIDLNGDGIPEFVVQGAGDFCSPTGNCSFWVFMKSGSTLKPILRRGAIQSFASEDSISNGFHDLVLGMHGSATEQGLFVYRFKDGSYQRTGCYEASWTRLVNDEVQQLDEPDIQPCGKR